MFGRSPYVQLPALLLAMATVAAIAAFDWRPPRVVYSELVVEVDDDFVWRAWQ